MADIIGRYEIIEEIGEGGFATVYRARDTQLDRVVALKELKALLLTDKSWVQRFRREARAIARLDHPRIVTIYDVGDVGGRQFIVMRLIDGPGLDELIGRRGRLSWQQTLDILTAIAEGLDYAHSQGILHRDLKPGNIMLDPERGPLLSDFGFAKLVGENSMSLSGDVVGTPHYIAPEAWEGESVTPPVDIYALGCILYEMLTGEKLFKGNTPPTIMMAHFKPLNLPASWPEGVPSGLNDVLAKALARKPENRYHSAGAMVAALAALPTSKPEKPAPENQARERQPAETSPTQTGRAAPVVAGETRSRKSDQGNRARRHLAGGVDSAQAAMTPDASGTAKAAGRREPSGKWRGFLAHLGPYIIVIGFLALINLFTSDYPWFIWPALGWGAGLVFHLRRIILDSQKHLSDKWRGFLGHLSSYAIIITFLAAINLFTSPDSIWFHWPALGWGAGLAIHLWGAFMSRDGAGEQSTGKTAQELVETEVKLERQEEIIDSTMQAHLDKARSYKEQIHRLIKTTANRKASKQLEDLAAQMDEWTLAIEALARRVDRFQQDSLIRHDLETVPESIKQLENRLSRESDEATRLELERTLTNRQNQLAALERLQNTMKRAEIQIESTLSALGTIYPQLLDTQSIDQVADYSRLAADVDEEVRTLQDHLEALEEVKLGRVT